MPVRQLPEQVVNRIAAGEVVERPASVVKELVENAIDAGASRIDIFTDGGGRRKIAITDDGGGMTHADLALAVERHATSKLDDEDLLSIRTLGFRGEALPSIGAVAKLNITTRHAGEPHAWSLSVEGGVKSAIAPAALSQGTRVEVSDLFYATPARLKFLKTDRTEAEAIREVVRRLAMARPDIAFTLAGEERSPVTWAAALPGAPGQLTRLGDILGADFRASAIDVRAEREGVVVEGFAAAPSLTRAGDLRVGAHRAVGDRALISSRSASWASARASTSSGSSIDCDIEATMPRSSQWASATRSMNAANARPRVLGVGGGAGLGLEPAHALGGDRGDQVVLGREAAVDGALADAGAGGDLGHHRRLALLGKTSAAAAITRSRLRTASARVRAATAVMRGTATGSAAKRPRRLGIRNAAIAATSATPALTRNASV